MLIFGTTSYLVGGCAAAFVHKKFINKNNLNIKLVALVDQRLYEYKDDMLIYFDEVIKIDLIEIKLNPQYNLGKFKNKYSKWIKYSVNKWQTMNLDHYDKVLLLDTDVLPLKDSFYDIFNIDTFAFVIKPLNNNFNQIVNIKDLIKNDINISNLKYFDSNKILKKVLDASVVLIKPNKTLYNDYVKFLKLCEGKYGYMSYGGVDESTLEMFLLLYKKIETRYISYDFAVIPWRKDYSNKENIKGINYIAWIKPWQRLPFIQWSDEIVWHMICKQAFKLSKNIKKIYVCIVIEQLYKLITSLDTKDEELDKYNLKSLDNLETKDKTLKLINYLKNNDITKSNKQIKKILKYTFKIYQIMSKDMKLTIDNSYLMNIITENK
jgi:hypothetical protein